MRISDIRISERDKQKSRDSEKQRENQRKVCK